MSRPSIHNNVLRKLPLPKCGLTGRGTFRIEASCTIIMNKRIRSIQGYPIRVFKWTPTFTSSQEYSIVPIWFSFPELPAHLFYKDVIFTVASMMGTPLQIDDATLNQSKLLKAWVCIEIDLLKPRFEEFELEICGETIVQRTEYEQIPQYCSLCKHVGHQDSECYLKGNAPKPPTRKPCRPANTKGKGKQVSKTAIRDKTPTSGSGEC
ncbi:hypothetical protein Sango_0657100 [Sesamum angolense]|uniref:DUF4283 domain-containing protein n=1 Tax=Sesamum angolense TaxID=2727404 RepID=A0AAE2C2D3_9LAMI|nr:hypothetical protein Sango_0657100 [Sesamum angolense]